MEDEIRCPYCNSNQIVANKKGFSGKQAVAGAVLTGGIGLLAGTIGSNKIKIDCLACGRNFTPQKRLEILSEKSAQKIKMIRDSRLSNKELADKELKDNLKIGIVIIAFIAALVIMFSI